VTPVKLKHLLNTAKLYLVNQHLDDVPARLDIVSIDFVNDTEYRIELLKNVTGK
jgi:Holliday junction resolvase-like predicted endonuclease